MLPMTPPSGTFLPKRFGLGAWSGHVPFAYDLMTQFKPKLFVELGCHRGESYSAFCQAVSDFQLSTVCYGVDTWKGDKHAGFYEEKIYEDLLAFNQKNYSGFSYLVRKDFDSAQEQFSDRSIDLLHIDGLHTYEAVKHDFETWLPKIKESGIILFHDIVVRHDDFGVWKLWEELQTQYATFSFYHGYGLGVLAVDAKKLPPSSFLQYLFSSHQKQQDSPVFQSAYGESIQNLRDYYYNIYQKLQTTHDATQKLNSLETLLSELNQKQKELIEENRLLKLRLNRRAFRWTAYVLSFLDRHSWLKFGV